MTEPKEPRQISPQHELAERICDAQLEQARQVGSAERFSHYDAELLLRNPAVFTDRLKPDEFAQLSEPLQIGFAKLADTVQDQLGVKVDADILPHETEQEHLYRTEIWGVMHGLQSMALMGPGNERGYDPEKEVLVRKAVFLASDLFCKSLLEAVDLGFPGVVETLNYFSGNVRVNK